MKAGDGQVLKCLIKNKFEETMSTEVMQHVAFRANTHGALMS